MKSIRKALVVVALGLGLVIVGAAPAVAAAERVVPTESTVLTFDTTTWSTLQSVIVPIVVGLLVKAAASDRLKVLANIAVNAVGALLGSFVVLDGVATLSKPTLTMWVFGTIGSIATHYGIWKPLNVTSSTSKVLLPTVGVG